MSELESQNMKLTSRVEQHHVAMATSEEEKRRLKEEVGASCLAPVPAFKKKHIYIWNFNKDSAKDNSD